MSLFDDLHQARLADDAVEQLGIGMTEPDAKPEPERVDPRAARDARAEIVLALCVGGALTRAQIFDRVRAKLGQHVSDDFLSAHFKHLVEGGSVLKTDRAHRLAGGRLVPLWSIKKGLR